MTIETISEGARLLVADDDSLVLATLAAGLRGFGYDVTAVESGEEVVQLCEDGDYDLALLDMRMPGLSGLETAHSLNEFTQIPIVFLSAFDDSEYVEQAVAAGALGYLVKPVDVNQVVPTIEAALNRAKDIGTLKDREENLTQALSAGRETNVAIGILMAQTAMSYPDAEQALRNYARANRKRMNDIATDMVSASNTLNYLITAIRNQSQTGE